MAVDNASLTISPALPITTPLDMALDSDGDADDDGALDNDGDGNDDEESASPVGTESWSAAVAEAAETGSNDFSTWQWKDG